MNTETPIERVLAKLHGVTGRKPQWSARCPGHDDKRQSLSVGEAPDGVVKVKCHAGCDTETLLGVVGLSLADLYPQDTRRNGSDTWTPRGEAVAVYSYADESGVVLFEVCRTADKQFSQRRPDPIAKSGYTWKLNGVRRVPYHLPQLHKAVEAGRGIFIAEGEKDVHHLEAEGFTATTNPSGAGKWRPEFSPHFKGATVYILPDNDDVGRTHAEQVAGTLHGVAKEVRIVTLPGLAEHGDVSDWFAAGGTPGALKKLVQETPRWAGPVTTGTPAPAATPVPSQSLTETPPAPIPSFPVPSDAAFYGLAGEIVDALDPYTESDRVAVLVQLLAAFGNAVQRTPHFSAGADDHFLGLFVLLVGQTASGRKGSSWTLVKRLMSYADDGWVQDNISSGLSSGEGLIGRCATPSRNSK